MLLPIAFICPHCVERIESAADPSQGSTQSYIEDCQVCCRPIIINVAVDLYGSIDLNVTNENE